MAAYKDMYGDIPVDEDAQKSMDEAFSTTNPTDLIKRTRESEERENNLLQGFQAEYPDMLNEGNINDILQTLAAKASNNGNTAQSQLTERKKSDRTRRA